MDNKDEENQSSGPLEKMISLFRGSGEKGKSRNLILIFCSRCEEMLLLTTPLPSTSQELVRIFYAKHLCCQGLVSGPRGDPAHIVSTHMTVSVSSLVEEGGGFLVTKKAAWAFDPNPPGSSTLIWEQGSISPSDSTISLETFAARILN
jgi:hypothetical protein